MATEYKCTVCDATFAAPRWNGCCDDKTLKHKVESVRYFSRFKAFTCFPIQERKGIDVTTGEKFMVPGVAASFGPQGQYTTDDPEIQAWMSSRGGGALISKDQYEDIHAPGLRQERMQSQLVETADALAKAKEALASLRAKIDTPEDPNVGTEKPSKRGK